MKTIVPILVIFQLLSSCSSSRLVDEYVNAEHPYFQANKVLVIGLTPDGGLQRQFEYSLVNALMAENIMAVKSSDYFEEPIYEIDQSEENLANLKIQLMEAGFDAVLFSKITGQQSKVTVVQSYRNLIKSFESFNDYYNQNRPVHGNEQIEDYPVYNTETSLYCLCSEKERDLVWRAQIDIVDPPKAATTIRDYIKTLVRTLEKNNLLIVK